MPFLSAEAIREFMKSEDLITDYQLDINNLEGSMALLTLKQVYKKINDDKPIYIGKQERSTPNYAPVGLRPSSRHDNELSWVLLPNNFYQFECYEEINLNPQLIGLVLTRRSYIISQVNILSTAISCGYSGPIMVGCHIISDEPVEIERGAPLCPVLFATLSLGLTDPYKHKVWKGRKTSTNGFEVGF